MEREHEYQREHEDQIGVIGSGLGGLAAACTLAARGHRVTVFEKNDWLGGKAAVLEQDGYRFDMGPTILILSSVMRRLFAEAGLALEDRIDLVELDPQWRCFFADGSRLDLVRDRRDMETGVEDFAPGSGPGYRSFMELSETLHRVSDRHFLWKSVGSMLDTFDAGSTFQPSVLADLWSLGLGRSVASTVRRHVSDPRVAQMVDHFTQYVGSSPAASPAVLCGIAHMQIGEGVWYPKGGIRAVPEALVRLGRELGVEYRTGEGVRRILVEDGAACGVETESGEHVRLAAVVSNSDAARTFSELVGGKVARRFARRHRLEPACSGVVLYLGLEERYDHLLHHNFVFSEDPEAEFHDIYERGRPAADPTCYVCAPAVTDPSVAPEGGEALYVLVHTPYLRPGHDWSRMLPEYRRTILDKLKTVGGMEDLEGRIAYEAVLTPQDIHDRYRVLDGAIYGLASHGLVKGAFKPANRSPLEGLYLAGGAAHPGPGTPMVMMSGWIAGDALDADLARDRKAAGEEPRQARKTA